MGCCLSRKPKKRSRNNKYKVYSNENAPLTHPPHHLITQPPDNKTEIILKDVSHITIKLTLNPDDTTTYTISRPKHSQELSSIEIVSSEKEISITKSPLTQSFAQQSDNSADPLSISSPETDTLPPRQLKENSSKDSINSTANLQPHPPLRQPSDMRRPRLKYRSQAVSSLISSEPSSSTLGTDPSLPSLFQTDSSTGVLTPTSTSEYDIESPLAPHSPPHAVPDKHRSQSLPANLQEKPPDTTHTQVRSLPSQDSTGLFSKSTRSLITSTPPLPPLLHRTPITPFPQEGTPLRVPVYENGDRRSYASFPKRIKHPNRYHGRFRCKECLWDWTSSYTWEGWGQKCRRCKTSSSPCFPYRLDTIQDSSQVASLPHSPTHCLRCQFLKRTMDKSATCINFASTHRTSLAQE